MLVIIGIVEEGLCVMSSHYSKSRIISDGVEATKKQVLIMLMRRITNAGL